MLDYKLIEALAMVVQEGGFERAAGTLEEFPGRIAAGLARPEVREP